MNIESRSKRVCSGNKKHGKNEDFNLCDTAKKRYFLCVAQIKNKRKNTQINKK